MVGRGWQEVVVGVGVLQVNRPCRRLKICKSFHRWNILGRRHCERCDAVPARSAGRSPSCTLHIQMVFAPPDYIGVPASRWPGERSSDTGYIERIGPGWQASDIGALVDCRGVTGHGHRAHIWARCGVMVGAEPPGQAAAGCHRRHSPEGSRPSRVGGWHAPQV